MFGFRRITLFCLENVSQSTKLLYFPKIWGAWTLWPPTGYAYVLLVWKFMTSNESVKVLKVEAWYWTILIKDVCKMLKLILKIFAKCWKPIHFLVKYKAKDKRALNAWFPVKNSCYGEDATICRSLANFCWIWLFLRWVWRQFFISIWQPCESKWKLQWRKTRTVAFTSFSQYNRGLQISLLWKAFYYMDCIRNMWWARATLLTWSHPW